MNLRAPETQAAYEAFKTSYAGACVFCDLTNAKNAKVLETSGSMKVIRNQFPYLQWDNFTVGDHRMIVPKRHIGSLQEFNDTERDEYFDLLQRYEADHYSIYLRAPTNPTRTVMHLHTHLIKPAGV